MLEQMIRVVETENTISGTILPFGPLGNASHRKRLIEKIQKDCDEAWKKMKAEDTIGDLTKNDVTNEYYNNIFPTIEILNSQGWKLESFAIIYDNNELRMQVAIFSREV